MIVCYLYGGPCDGELVPVPHDVQVYHAERSGDVPLQSVHVYVRATRGKIIDRLEYRGAMRREDAAKWSRPKGVAS